MLPPISSMDISLDVDFTTFGVEPVTSVLKNVDTKSHVTSPRKKMNLSPFRGLAIRQNPSSWARAFKPHPTVVIRDTKKATEKAPDIDVYGREQVLSTCAIEQYTTALDVTVIKAVPKAIMKPVAKSFAKAIKSLIHLICGHCFRPGSTTPRH